MVFGPVLDAVECANECGTHNLIWICPSLCRNKITITSYNHCTAATIMLACCYSYVKFPNKCLISVVHHLKCVSVKPMHYLINTLDLSVLNISVTGIIIG